MLCTDFYSLVAKLRKTHSFAALTRSFSEVNKNPYVALQFYEVIYIYKIPFDLPLGRLFDKDGNVNNWWSIISGIGFSIRENCLSEQYSKFEVYDKKVNRRAASHDDRLAQTQTLNMRSVL